eukprot:GHVU01083341.1.p1 GENE.GHVU01083341.1~~GHVU01083341.1.p1  ORF type:complete len:542 (+),score=73.41 GHVU01083341.1:25-1626(+)
MWDVVVVSAWMSFLGFLVHFLDQLSNQSKKEGRAGKDRSPAHSTPSSPSSSHSTLRLQDSQKSISFDGRMDKIVGNPAVIGQSVGSKMAQLQKGPALNPAPRPALTKAERESQPEKSSSTPLRTNASDSLSSTELENYVGFANLPNQIYRKSVKQGFDFNLMVVGASGLGKSTLVNSLFLTNIYGEDHPGPSLRIHKTVKVEESKVILKEGGVHLRLNVIDTPGFGDSVDNSNCWVPVLEYIDSKYSEYLMSESRVQRITVPDNRVHCCLYFISPNGHGLTPLDVEFMKSIHTKVNVLPVIAKADTMTPEECREFKKTIMNEIKQHNIKIYELPEAHDEEETKIISGLKDRVPFAVIGSNTTVESQGRKVRGRAYPWGVVEVEKLEHNDFVCLRNMLTRTHMQDLKDVTNNNLYESFRFSKLSVNDKDKLNPGGLSGMFSMDKKRQSHDQKMKKMMVEMEDIFKNKVDEKTKRLKEAEADLNKQAEQLRQTFEKLSQQYEEERAKFDREKTAWEMEHKNTLENKKGSKKGFFH